MILYMHKVFEYYGDVTEDIMREALNIFPETTIVDNGNELISTGLFDIPAQVKLFNERFINNKQNKMNNQLMTTDTVVSDAELIMHLENLGLVKELTQGEKNSYLQIAKAYNLNPFKREIHVSKYNGQMSIITGYEVYIKRAERSGQLDGWSAVTTGTAGKGDLKATVTIHRKDRSHPFIWEASYSEFVQKTKEGNVTKFWQKADFMIKKVAISQAFRLCFSDELGGMPYTKEEMADVQDITAEVTSSEIKQPAPPAKKKLSDKAFNEGMEKASKDHSLLDRLENEYNLNEVQLKTIADARA